MGSLQNELALYRNQREYGMYHRGKDEEILHLNERIKIIKNDNQRLSAMNKNDQITFHQQMYLYQTKIAKELQQIIEKNKAQKKEMDKKLKQMTQERDFYLNQLQCSQKRRKLNDGSYKTTNFSL